MEANAEIRRMIESPSFFVTPTGGNIRNIGNEGKQTLYMLTRDPSKKSKKVPRGEVERLLAMPPEEFTFSLYTSLFADTFDKKEKKKVPSRYETNDIIELQAGDLYNKTAITTTIGRLFFNKVIIEACGLQEVTGYFNKVMTSDMLKTFETHLATNITEGNISTKQMVKYIDHRDWLGYQGYATICSSFTDRTIRIPKEVTELKKKLIEANKEKLQAGDAKTAEFIEKQLVALTEKILDDDPGMEFFKSGSKVSTGNNLKNIILMRGAIFNPVTGEYDIVTNSLLDGMEKDKFAAHSNALITGSYPKAVGTADSGYLSKQLSAAMQTEIIDEDGSDCGTQKTLLIDITPENKSRFAYRNIKSGSGFIQLTPDNINNYIGKRVHMFSPMYCTGDRICAKCAGKYGNKYIGLDTNKIATTLTNLNMKKFHDNTIKSTELKPDEIFILNRKPGVIINDGKNLVLNDKYVEFYIPEFYFNPSFGFAEDLGDKYSVFGVFNVGVFTGNNVGYMDTLNIPGNILLNVYEMEYRNIELLGLGTTPCRVIKYYEKNIITKNFLIQDSVNAQTFLRCVIYGKLPNSIPYSKAIQIWQRNQDMNSVNFGVPSVIQEVVLRVSYRNKNNVAQPFAKLVGRNDVKVSDYDYKMASVRQICQYASTFSAITFEDFTTSVTSSINRKREKKQENESPVEALFKM